MYTVKYREEEKWVTVYKGVWWFLARYAEWRLLRKGKGVATMKNWENESIERVFPEREQKNG